MARRLPLPSWRPAFPPPSPLNAPRIIPLWLPLQLPGFAGDAPDDLRVDSILRSSPPAHHGSRQSPGDFASPALPSVHADINYQETPACLGSISPFSLGLPRIVSAVPQSGTPAARPPRTIAAQSFASSVRWSAL